MGPDSNPNTASAIGPATMARLEHGPLETHRRPEAIRGQNGWGGASLTYDGVPVQLCGGGVWLDNPLQSPYSGGFPGVTELSFDPRRARVLCVLRLTLSLRRSDIQL